MSESISIEMVPFKGATYCGQPIRRIIAVLQNGQKVELDAQCQKDDDTANRNIASMSKRILAFMKSTKIALVRKQIAKGLGLSNSSGWFGTAIRTMIDDGTILEDEEGFLSLPESAEVQG